MPKKTARSSQAVRAREIGIDNCSKRPKMELSDDVKKLENENLTRVRLGEKSKRLIRYHADRASSDQNWILLYTGQLRTLLS